MKEKTTMSSASSYPFNREHLVKEQSLYDELRRWLPEQPYLTEDMAVAVHSLGVELFGSRDSSPEERRPLYHQARWLLTQHLAPREDEDFGSRVMKWYDDMLDADELYTLQVMCQRFLSRLEDHVQPPAYEDEEDDEEDDEYSEDEDEDGYVDTGKF